MHALSLELTKNGLDPFFKVIMVKLRSFYGQFGATFIVPRSLNHVFCEIYKHITMYSNGIRVKKVATLLSY